MKTLLALLLALAVSHAAQAADARPLADDPAVEQRMVNLTQDLRCLVCQNESLAASQADLAKDLREQVRGLIRQGYSDRQIVDYLVQRYGNFVRYRPPLDAETALLWFGPFALLACGLGVLIWQVRRRGTAQAVPLDPQQLERAHRLLASQTDKEL